MDILAWFSNLFSHILDFFKKEVPPIEQKIVHFADTVTNSLKTVTGSAEFQTVLNGLEAVAESIDPALTPMIQGLNLAIPKIVTTVTGVDTTIDSEASKTLEQQAVDALTKLQNVKGIDTTVYAGWLATLNATIQKFITSNNGIVVPDAQLLTAGQAVHAASNS